MKKILNLCNTLWWIDHYNYKPSNKTTKNTLYSVIDHFFENLAPVRKSEFCRTQRKLIPPPLTPPLTVHISLMENEQHEKPPIYDFQIIPEDPNGNEEGSEYHEWSPLHMGISTYTFSFITSKIVPSGRQKAFCPDCPLKPSWYILPVQWYGRPLTARCLLLLVPGKWQCLYQNLHNI